MKAIGLVGVLLAGFFVVQSRSSFLTNNLCSDLQQFATNLAKIPGCEWITLDILVDASKIEETNACLHKKYPNLFEGNRFNIYEFKNFLRDVLKPEKAEKVMTEIDKCNPSGDATVPQDASDPFNVCLSEFYEMECRPASK